MASVSFAEIQAATNAALCAASTAHEFLLAVRDSPEYQDRCGRRYRELFMWRLPWQTALDRVASIVVSDQPGASIVGGYLGEAWSVPGESFHQAAVTLAHLIFCTASNATLEAYVMDCAIPEPVPLFDLNCYWPAVRSAVGREFGPRVIAASGPGEPSEVFISLFDLEAASAAIRRENILAKRQSQETMQPPRPTPTRLTVSLEPPQATFDGIAYSVTPDGAMLLDVLVKANGDWRTGAKHFSDMRPDRVRKKLPPVLRELVESGTSKGYRIERSKLA